MAKASSASLSYESLAIGIDIGGTGTKYGIVDRNGNLLFSGEMSTRGFETVESFIEPARADRQGGWFRADAGHRGRRAEWQLL
jgi:hypothetical protein